MSSPLFRSAAGEAEAMAAFDAAMALWPVPFEHRDVGTDFGSTHVIVSGEEDAPPLVLLHCALMSSAVWSPLIGALTQRFRTYAVDVIGDFGRSVPSHPPAGEMELAKWLGQTLDALGLARTALLGWSFGGFVAANFALHVPARVSRLALLAPFAVFARPGPGFLAGFVPMLFPSCATARWFERRLCRRGSFAIPEHSEILYQRFKNGRVALRTAPRVFSDSELRSLTMPVLLLVGEDEFLYDGAKAVDRGKRLLPAGESWLIPRCNHAVVTDRTAAVRDRLLRFLAA